MSKKKIKKTLNSLKKENKKLKKSNKKLKKRNKLLLKTTVKSSKKTANHKSDNESSPRKRKVGRPRKIQTNKQLTSDTLLADTGLSVLTVERMNTWKIKTLGDAKKKLSTISSNFHGKTLNAIKKRIAQVR